jgi:hypothetical protein
MPIDESDLAAGEEVVDADRPGPLEDVAGGEDALLTLDPPEIGLERVDRPAIDRVLDDGVTVALDAPEMSLDVLRRQHDGSPRYHGDRRWRPARALGRGRRCYARAAASTKLASVRGVVV